MEWDKGENDMSITGGDKYVQFVIDNFNDIEAMNEIYEHALNKLPNLIDNAVIESLYGLADYFEKQGFKFNFEEGEFAWWDRKFFADDDDAPGPYFGYEVGEIKKWSTSEDDNNICFYVYIYVDSIKKVAERKNFVKKWETKLKKNKGILQSKGVSLREDIDYNDPYVAYYYLNREVNMETIGQQDELLEKVKAAAKEFTSTM